MRTSCVNTYTSFHSPAVSLCLILKLSWCSKQCSALLLSTAHAHHPRHGANLHFAVGEEITSDRKASKDFHNMFISQLYSRTYLLTISSCSDCSCAMTDANQFAHFLSPLRVGDLLIKNRIVMASLTRNRDSIPRENLHVPYYAERADTGLIASYMSDERSWRLTNIFLKISLLKLR